MQTRWIGLLWLAGIAVGLFAAVFVVTAWLHGHPTEADGRLIAVPTAPAVVPAADGTVTCLMAAFGGRLTSHPVWGIAVRNLDGTITPMIWPHGYVARVIGNELQLLNADAQVVARAGDWIEGGGGEARVGNVTGFGVCPVGIHVKPAWP